MESLEDTIPIKIGKYEIDWDNIGEDSNPFEMKKTLRNSISSTSPHIKPPNPLIPDNAQPRFDKIADDSDKNKEEISKVKPIVKKPIKAYDVVEKSDHELQTVEENNFYSETNNENDYIDNITGANLDNPFIQNITCSHIDDLTYDQTLTSIANNISDNINKSDNLDSFYSNPSTINFLQNNSIIDQNAIESVTGFQENGIGYDLQDNYLNKSQSEEANISVNSNEQFFQCHSFMMENNDHDIVSKERKNIPKQLLDTTLHPNIQIEPETNLNTQIEQMHSSDNKIMLSKDIMDATIYEDNTTVSCPNILVSQLSQNIDGLCRVEEFFDPSSFDYLQNIGAGGDDVDDVLRDSIYTKFDPICEKGGNPAETIRQIDHFLHAMKASQHQGTKGRSSAGGHPTIPARLPPSPKTGYQTPPEKRTPPSVSDPSYNTITKGTSARTQPLDTTPSAADASADSSAFDTVVKVPRRNPVYRRSDPEQRTRNDLKDLRENGVVPGLRRDRGVVHSLDETVLLKGTPPANRQPLPEVPACDFAGAATYNTDTIVLNKRRGPAHASQLKLIPTTTSAAAPSTADLISDGAVDRSGNVFIGALDYPPESIGQRVPPTVLNPTLVTSRETVGDSELPPTSTLIQWQSKRLLLEREIAVLKQRCTTLEAQTERDGKAFIRALEVLEVYKHTLLQRPDPRNLSPHPPAPKSSPPKEGSTGDDYRELVKEKNQLTEDVKGVEVAFADLHRRYEKLKTYMENYKSNEEVLRKTLADRDEELAAQLATYNNFFSHSTNLLDSANQEIDKLKLDHKADNLALQAKLKMLEMKTQSLERDLAQKVEENAQLSNVCNDLISNMGVK